MPSTHQDEPPGSGSVASPSLFAQLVDDATLLLPRSVTPPMADVVRHYLDARSGQFAALSGQLVCPVSRLPELVTELVKARPVAPVDISLVVDTGLGAVPKALSLVLSRDTLLTPSTVETPAPPDVDSVWLERVAEFVPEDVVAVVEPRRPLSGDTMQWLDAVRRVAEHGCTPKLRLGGTRSSDVPSADQIADFLTAASAAPAGFTTSFGPRHAVRRSDSGSGWVEHGVLNLLVAVARAVFAGDVRAALTETDAGVLADEAGGLSDGAARAVRKLLSRCGAGPGAQPADELAGLGLL